MPEAIEVSRVFPAPARRVFEAWLDPTEHALMTGASTSAGEGGAYTAWDGYIDGRTVSSEPYSRITQRWRTTEFPDGHPDSQLVIELTEVANGTELKLTHTGLPDGSGESYASGWNEHYFDHMERYFASPREKVREVGQAIEELASSAQGALEDAVEQAGEAIEDAADKAQKALSKAGKRASAQAKKAVKKGKQVKKKVAAQARSLGKRVRALVQRKKAATPKKAKLTKKPKAKATKRGPKKR